MMPYPASIIVIALLSLAAIAALTWKFVGLVRPHLERLDVLDRPTARSSHSVAKPRGAGLPLVLVILLFWIFPTWAHSQDVPGLWLVVLGTVLLSGVSLADDIWSLPQVPRLIVQAVVIAVVFQYQLPRYVFAGCGDQAELQIAGRLAVPAP